MKRFRIEEHPLFSADDVAPAVNAVVAAMEPGDQAVLSYGVYRFGGTIRIQNPNGLRYCRIALEGEYTYTGSGPALRIEGEHLDFSLQRIATGRRSDFYKTSPDDVLPTGVEVGECNYSRLDFGEIEGFEYGLKLCPDRDDTGICYTKFTFQYISYCYIPLYFGVDDGAVAWINENQFTGGRLKGYYGMVARKGARQIDEYNNNTLYSIAFEAIETNAIDWEFCTFNTILSPRFESVMGLAVRETETCKSNKYRVSVAIPLDTVDIRSKYTDMQIPLHTYWEHMIRAIRTDGEGNKSYEFFRELSVQVDNEDRELPMNCKNLLISADRAPVTLQLHPLSAFENNSIGLWIQSAAYPIRILDDAGRLVYQGGRGAEGTDRLTYTDGRWLSDKPSGVPAACAV